MIALVLRRVVVNTHILPSQLAVRSLLAFVDPDDTELLMCITSFIYVILSGHFEFGQAFFIVCLYNASVFLLKIQLSRVEYKIAQISNQVRTTRFQNNLHQVRSEWKGRKTKQLKTFWSTQIKGSKQDSQNRLLSPMPEGGEPQF